MKPLNLILATTIVALTTASCGTNKQEAPRVLVLYYSQTGNTKAVAQENS